MRTISPDDAEVALRTFPRRWRSLLGALDADDPELDALVRHPGPDGASALACAGRAASALEQGEAHLRRAVTTDRPTLDDAGAPATPATVQAALARIDRTAPALADTVGGLAPGDLDREAVRGASTVSVRILLTDTVEEVAALLRKAERALAEARDALR